MSDYKCFICKKRGVKLWRPYMGTAPLVCATCAEKFQSPSIRNEEICDNTSQNLSTEVTKEKYILLPEWIINDEGLIPAFNQPHKKGSAYPLTDKLIINLSPITPLYQDGSTTMIPAVPIKSDTYWGYTAVPEDRRIWWKKLPTR